MSSFRVYPILLLLVCGLWACLDHRIPAVTPGSNTTRLRVKALTLELPNNAAKVSSFRYDAQNRLSSILTYQTPDSTVSEIEFSNYQYDGQNRLIGLRRSALPFPRPQNGLPLLVEQYSYLYNAAGQVSGVNYANGFSVGLFYDSAGKLLNSTRFFSISGLNLRGSDQFTFTGDNLTTYATERNIPSRGGNDPIVKTTTIYTHDDKVNPFYGVYVIPTPSARGVNLQFGPGVPGTLFGGIDNILNLSRNNVLTQASTGTFTVGGTTTTSPGSVSTSQYEYNAANLPTVRTTTTTPAGSTATVETLRFEYESY